ncbi:unnamed protein product, partial [marine sediment metagenome]
KINSIIDSRTQSMEDALYASGIKGNVAAQIFWLKNRAKDRWSDRTTHEVALELTFANLMKMKKKQGCLDNFLLLSLHHLSKLK